MRDAELKARKAVMQEMKMPSQTELGNFFEKQLAVWPDAAERYRHLADVRQRNLENGLTLQYNPSRAVSTSAKVDSESVKQRSCFLCAENRPLCQFAEKALNLYDVLVNPYPILPFHFTLPLKEHTPQLFEKMKVDMLLFAKEWRDMAIFYNGAKCGASAPDHAHLQAVCKNDVPLLGTAWKEILSNSMEPLYMNGGDGIYKVDGYVVPFFVVQANSVNGAVLMLDRLQAAMSCSEGEPEPRMNVICCYDSEDGYAVYVFPRSLHRPSCYSVVEGCGRMVSPGTLDMAGLVVTPRENDFLEITANEAVSILKEVAVDEGGVEVMIENILACNEEN